MPPADAPLPDDGGSVARTRGSYDRIAASYNERFRAELDDKPFDREFLDRVASLAGATGAPRDGRLFVDLGCGPGQIGRHLAGRGLSVVGIDLSMQMLRQARTGAGVAMLAEADIRLLPLREASVAGLVAFYSLIHIPPDDLPGAFAEMARILRRGGVAGMAVHATQPAERAESARPLAGGGLRIEEMLCRQVAIDFYFYDADRLAALLEAAGLDVLWAQERDPYDPSTEVQTRRAYLIASKPG